MVTSSRPTLTSFPGNTLGRGLSQHLDRTVVGFQSVVESDLIASDLTVQNLPAALYSYSAYKKSYIGSLHNVIWKWPVSRRSKRCLRTPPRLTFMLTSSARAPSGRRMIIPSRPWPMSRVQVARHASLGCGFHRMVRPVCQVRGYRNQAANPRLQRG